MKSFFLLLSERRPDIHSELRICLTPMLLRPMKATSGISVLSGIMSMLVALLTKSAGRKKNLCALVSSLDVAPGTNGKAASFRENFSVVFSVCFASCFLLVVGDGGEEVGLEVMGRDFLGSGGKPLWTYLLGGLEMGVAGWTWIGGPRGAL